MEPCPRCRTAVEGGWPYCPTCNRPRILESLQAPFIHTRWQHQAWRGVILLALLWLVVTLAVAFLREAKAVRMGRQLLAQGQEREAWTLLGPFLAEHPEHQQALFLCGKAAIRLNLRADARQCFEKTTELSPELANELRLYFGGVLTDQARGLGCNAEAFLDLLAWAEELKGDLAGKVVTGLDRVLDTCRAAKNDHVPQEIATALKDKGRAMEMLQKGYVPSIRKAIIQARYFDAEALAQAAVYFVPEGSPMVEELLNTERQKIAITEENLRMFGIQLRDDQRYRVGGSWCFPAALPTNQQPVSDGWGHTVIYTPLGEAGDRCYRGFALTSYGGDGVVTERASPQSPAAELIYSFWAGGEYWQLPGRFWRPRA
jgi:tetratricopeptide (TPR) repeat protein